MIITFPAAQSRPLGGARPINLNRDIPQVLELLEIVFGESLRNEGNDPGNMGLDTSLPFLYRFNLGMTRLSPGFVWEENGRIVGNATLIRTKGRDRYLVVNVSVHPNYRRHGIARRLMEAIIEQVRAEGGRFIMLQVVKDNYPAIDLYKSLNFQVLGSITSWYSAVSRVRTIPAAIEEQRPSPAIRELKGSEWRAAYELDQRCLLPELNWPEPLAMDSYKMGWWRRFSDLMNGRQTETWVTSNAANHLTSMAQILSEWGKMHTVHLRIDPAWWGQLERPLLAKVTRRLKYLGQRNIRLDHIDDHEEMNELLPAANFDAKRTLTHMRLQIM